MGWALLFFFLLFHSPLSAQIRINEVYYDHPGRDEGHEFVELLNLDVAPLSLAGYTLEFHDGSSLGWKAIWSAAPADTIGGGSLFVVGGGDVSPLPDRISNFVLENGPDALRLVAYGSVEDRVGYGALSDPEYYEAASAPDVSEGSSLGRYPDGHDTDHNATDFRALEPSPGLFNRARRTVAVTSGRETCSRRALDDGALEELRVFVVNRGLAPVVPHAVVVEVVDSAEFSVVPLYETVIPETIAAGDSMEVAFLTALERGYHRVRVFARYDGDERPQDNVLTLLRRVGDPPLLISEVMSHPSESCPEYVELYNAGVATYRFVDHFMRDRAHDPVRVDSVLRVIAPGDHVVITENKARLVACFANLDTSVVVEVEGTWPTLNQSGTGAEADSIIVLDHFLLPLDRVAYPAQPSESRGRSLERVDLYAGVRPHVWVLSTDGGSPGRAHRQAILKSPHGVGATVQPNPFDPTRGGELVIIVGARSEPTRTWVQLFDVGGRRVRDIGSSTSLPFVFLWNGRDEHGRPVVPGIYVIACEYRGLISGERVVERVVLGCGRETR